ncbi:MAG: nuclear transport factor 2 family protein [Pseudomonadota bacterium]
MSNDLLARVEELEQEVRALRAREDIRTLRNTYHEYINERHYEQIPGLFTDDARLDFGYLGKATGQVKISKFFAAAPKLLQFVKQFIHSHTIELDGDSGTGWSYMEAKSIAGDEAYLVAGRYDDCYTLIDGRWRFSVMNFQPYFTVPFKDPAGWATDDRLRMGAK